jgi:threonine dehydrogenase-like Zn-dependent dehydrogenase
MFRHNIGLVGGVAPSRLYTPALIEAVLAGDITPGEVFDRRMTLEELPTGYVEMTERRAIKVWATP